MSTVRNLITAFTVVFVIVLLAFFLWQSSTQSKASNARVPTPTSSPSPTPTDTDEETMPLSFVIGEFTETGSSSASTPTPSPTPLPKIPTDQLIVNHFPHSGPGYTMSKRDMRRSNGQDYIEIDIVTDGTKPTEEVISDFQSWVKTFGVTLEDLKKVKVVVIKP